MMICMKQCLETEFLVYCHLDVLQSSEFDPDAAHLKEACCREEFQGIDREFQKNALMCRW